MGIRIIGSGLPSWVFELYGMSIKDITKNDGLGRLPSAL